MAICILELMYVRKYSMHPPGSLNVKNSTSPFEFSVTVEEDKLI